MSFSSRAASSAGRGRALGVGDGALPVDEKPQGEDEKAEEVVDAQVLLTARSPLDKVGPIPWAMAWATRARASSVPSLSAPTSKSTAAPSTRVRA